MNKNKTILQRIWLGIKVGWNTPMLPEKVTTFNNHPLIRIFRVIGGISVITVLLKKHLLLWWLFQYLVLFIALLHISYFTIISIMKVFYGIYKLWKGDLNIRNSPLDRLASLGGNLLYCWKVGCYVASSGLSVAGASVVIDTVLEAGGQEKVFTPLLGKGVGLFVKGKSADTLYTEINDDVKRLKTASDKFKELKEITESCNTADDEVFSKDDKKMLKSAFDEIKNMEKSKLQLHAKELAKKIKEYSENSNNK